MTTVYLLLGSNLGNKKTNIEAAIQIIEERFGSIIKQSSLYKTKAWGNESQGDFFNKALVIKTHKNGADCLQTILEIEEQLGRKRKQKWDPRIIDIDKFMRFILIIPLISFLFYK